MKSIEFGEDGLKNLQEIGKQLFAETKDPRSFAYVRILERPKVNWFLVCLYVLAPFAVATAFGFFLDMLGVHLALCIAVPLVLILVFWVITAKKAALSLIKIYQRLAPERIRNKCRFEPSCSVYSSMAIEKYGLINGIKMTYHRLKRCNVDGGGIDYP